MSQARDTAMNLKMEKPVYGGDCLAHAEGKAVFVPLTLPGEAIFARITEEKRTFSKAELDEVLTPSPHRVEPRCPHFGACGGCHYQHVNYPAQLAIKEQILRETLTRSGVSVPTEIAVLAGDPWAYRNRIRLAVTADGQIGYRGRRSHEIIPIRECPIAAPLLVEVALDFASILDRKRPRNHLSEIELFSNQDDSEVLVTFHFHSADPTFHKLRFTPRESSSRPHLDLSDDPFLTYHVAGHDYRVPNGAFFQVNRHLLNKFAAMVTAGRSGKLTWDLYAGVGLFARQLTANFSQVVAVESAPASITALKQNLAGTASLAVQNTTVDFLRHNRQEREPGSDFLVLDPPRAGLGEEVTRLLNQIHAPAMVYVSCDPATLARDLRDLTAERYKISRITLVDMFPQTFHIETVVELIRS
jgi:23S rRNA (uracil1939-C5)-methyltransferase